MKKQTKKVNTEIFNIGDECLARKPYFTNLEKGVVIGKTKNKINTRYIVKFFGREPEIISPAFMYSAN